LSRSDTRHRSKSPGPVRVSARQAWECHADAPVRVGDSRAQPGGDGTGKQTLPLRCDNVQGVLSSEFSVMSQTNSQLTTHNSQRQGYLAPVSSRVGIFEQVLH